MQTELNARELVILDDTDRWAERRQEAMREVEAPMDTLGREAWWRRQNEGTACDL